ncbi:MAG TPA: S16 family serine protease [Actinomycetota bacterium]|nr:S16 family serine protease [Actinomycetota bacterium]
MGRLRRFWWVVPIALVLWAAGTVRLPYYSIGPGPARSVAPLITFEDHSRYESDGEFVLTSIHYERLTGLGVVRAWLDRDLQVVGRDFLFRPGESRQDEERRAISQMDQSKLIAASVVLSELTDYPDENGDGVLVEGVVEGCPADGELFPGDLVLGIDGMDVGDGADAPARRVIDGLPEGRRVTFDVLVDGETHDVQLRREPCAGDDRPVVGVRLIDNFPFGVRISSGSIGGPSAGLAWALGLYDLLTPGDLTGGRTIAVTGQLDIEGIVYAIGAPDEKVVAASRVGANVLILPEDNLEAARAVGDRGVELVPVRSFGQALAWLRDNGGATGGR